MKKLVISMLAMAMLTATMIGCSSTEQTDSGEVLSYTLFANEWQKYTGTEHDRILSEVEKKFNVSLNLTGAPSDGWEEKLTLMINTGEIPDMFFFRPGSTQYRMWVDSGVILPYDDYLKNTEYLKQIFAEPIYNNLSYNGKHYFLPMITLNNHAMYYRKDWLDNLGMKTPETLEEYEEMLKAFTENDPDGNGKNDTTGLTLSKVQGWLSSFYATFGMKYGWNKTADGSSYEPYYLTDNYADMMQWLREMYSNGYIKTEFFLDSDQQKRSDFFSGKAGVLLDNAGNTVDVIARSLKEGCPEAVIDVMRAPNGPGGKGAMVSYGEFYGGWNISSQAQEPERLVAMLDYLMSPEGQDLRLYGIEGIHYTVQDGQKVFNAEECANEPYDIYGVSDGKVGGLNGIGRYFSDCQIIYNNGKIEKKRDYSFSANKALSEKCDEIYVGALLASDTQNIIDTSEDYIEICAKMNDICQRYTVMMISGQISVDEGIQKIRQECNQVGYERAASEITEKMNSTAA